MAMAVREGYLSPVTMARPVFVLFVFVILVDDDDMEGAICRCCCVLIYFGEECLQNPSS
jgi:hypothetical protein